MPNKNKNKLLYWLALSQCPGIGPLHFFKILQHYPDLQDFFALSREQLVALGLKTEVISHLLTPDWTKIERALAWQDHQQHFIIDFHDPRYPRQLRTIANPPPVPFIAGDPSHLQKPQLAVVGSRNGSRQGLATGKDLAAQLATQGYLITSGLALGIDSACHLGALEAKCPTIAVLGSGLEQIYPRQHEQLAQRIATQAALVSDYLPDTAPSSTHFPQRNRIVSGLSQGVIVVEAALKSGSLITARLAMEQGREVFAIPGSIHRPQARGCHQLLKQGAVLVESIADIIPELPPTISEKKPNKQRVSGKAQELLQAMDDIPTPFDTLLSRINFPPELATSLLMTLELDGLIVTTGSGYLKTCATDLREI